MAHIEGECRLQGTLLPPRLDDFVAADHPVRVIDAYVDSLDLAALGFSRVTTAATGRPPYAPDDLLKLYIYGYLNQIRSSRRLEQEAIRNLELMWLLKRLRPSFKTIADFRKDHPAALVGVCRAFVQFCRRQALFGGTMVAIDGSKMEAAASRKQALTRKGLAKKMAALDRQIAEYLAAMDAADREAPAAAPVGDVGAALKALRERRESVRRQAEQLAAEGLQQRVVGEAEARLMRTARHGHQVAYNAQTGTDGKHGLIAAFELTNEGNDERQLYPMAELARAALAAETLTVVADTGYSSGEQGRLCEAAGITAIVPRPETVNPAGKQYFARDRFRYDAASDSWACPAGEILSCRQVSQRERKKKYWSKACAGCALKANCTEAAKRVIVRSFDEDWREAMHRRAKREPGWMKLRRELAEHPFATIKRFVPRFLVRGLEKARAELALGVLGFNLTRAITIRGVPALLAAIAAAQA